ncbi:MAG: FoF1 ATP synthase subunit gamma [Burkholderiaceae bacterium]
MSRRAQVQRHLAVLDDIGGIMGAMKNIALMETHKLARFVTHQHRVLESIDAAAQDFLGHYPEVGYRPQPGASGVVVVIGSQRGFCGDFNEALARTVVRHRRELTTPPLGVLVVGRRLAAKLDREPGVTGFDGPSVAEEVQPVLHRVMTALSELQAGTRRMEAIPVTVFAHREGETQVDARSILPAAPAASVAAKFAYPPLLNVAPRTFFAELARHYLWAQLHDMFYGSLMAESRRRLQHLEGATQRIQDKAALLQQKLNRLRQDEITEEIEVILLSNDALQSTHGVGR